MQTSLHAVKLSASAEPVASPLALWHLLSLDAPTVAALWVWFVARATHTPLAPAIPVVMFLAVWMLYAIDRLLDGSGTTEEPLEARHLFHREHRRAFIAAILLVAITIFPLLHEIPATILRNYSLLAALLLLWFGLIHFAPKRTLPKEIIPGPFFAAAIFLPIFKLALLPAAAAFALLCTLNCLSIYAWEHPETLRAPNITTRLGISHLTPLSILAICAPLAFPGPITLAISLSTALLFALNRLHNRLDPTDLRAAADLVLLTPLLIAPFLR